VSQGPGGPDDSDEAPPGGLPPRPLPPPEVLAAIAAAMGAEPSPAPPGDAADPAHLAWRFSGRWWNKPTPIRRERPWARR
jgi:hypothetical protein